MRGLLQQLRAERAVRCGGPSRQRHPFLTGWRIKELRVYLTPNSRCVYAFALISPFLVPILFMSRCRKAPSSSSSEGRQQAEAEAAQVRGYQTRGKLRTAPSAPRSVNNAGELARRLRPQQVSRPWHVPLLVHKPQCLVQPRVHRQQSRWTSGGAQSVIHASPHMANDSWTVPPWLPRDFRTPRNDSQPH